MFSELTLFKALCVLSICACCFPLYWHIKTANVPAVCLAVWFIVVNLCNLINVFIWGDVNIFTAWEGRVFCDIQVKILIAAAAGKMGAVAAITRNLANIMRDDLPVVKTRAMKRRALVEDLMLCFGVSIWMMGIHYVVQPDRYWLIGVKGCTASIDNSWPSIVLVHIWPPIICAAAVSYCCTFPPTKIFPHLHSINVSIQCSSSSVFTDTNPNSKRSSQPPPPPLPDLASTDSIPTASLSSWSCSQPQSTSYIETSASPEYPMTGPRSMIHMNGPISLKFRPKRYNLTHGFLSFWEFCCLCFSDWDMMP